MDVGHRMHNFIIFYLHSVRRLGGSSGTAFCFKELWRRSCGSVRSGWRWQCLWVQQSLPKGGVCWVLVAVNGFGGMVCEKSEACGIQCSILGILWMHIHWICPASCRDLDVSWHCFFFSLWWCEKGSVHYNLASTESTEGNKCSFQRPSLTSK